MGVISGASGLGFGAAFTLKDQFSATADKISGKMKKLSGITDEASRKINAGLGRIKKGFKQLAVGAVVLAPFALAINQAIEFESAFTGVRKTVELSDKGFQQLEANIRGMSKSIPVSAIELSALGEIAGQLGVKGVDNITKFIDTTAKIQATTNLTAEEAATSFARIANVMQIPIENVDRMASAAVDLGNNFATTEKEIVSFATRIAGAGKIAKITSADVFGISAAMASVGVEAEAGGTSVQKVLLKMSTAVATGNKDLGAFARTAGLSTKAFSDLTPIQRFQKFVTGLGKQGIGATTSLKELGLQDQRLVRSFLSLAGAGDLLNKTLDKSNKAFASNTALSKEADLRFKTTASRLQILKNVFTDLAVSVGEGLKPALNALIEILKPVLSVLVKIAQSAVGKFVIGLAFGIGVLAAAIGLYNLVMGAAKVATGLFTKTLLPLLPVLLPIIAVLAVLAGTIKFVKESLSAFKDVMAGGEIKGGFAGFMQKFGGILSAVMTIWRSATNEGFSMTVKMRDALASMGILDFVLALGTWIVRIKAFFGGVIEGVKVVWGIVTSVFGAIRDVIFSVGNALDKMVGGALKRWMDGFSKGQGTVSKWVSVGKVLGVIVGVVLVAAFTSLAVAVLAATWPLLVIIGIIAAVVAVFMNWGDIVDWISEKWGQFLDWLVEKFKGVFNWLMNLPSMLFNFGKNMVQSIRDGITSAWESLKTWLFDKMADLMDFIMPDFVKDELGIKSTHEVFNKPAPSTVARTTDALDDINNTGANNLATAGSPNINVAPAAVTAQAGAVNVTLEVDGDVVAQKVIDAESLDNSRR